jgi:hypothetical protein
VSANLCEALVGLSQFADQFNGLVVSLSWSKGRPPREPTPTRFEFAPDTIPVIQEAGRVLRATTPREEFQLYGSVVRLDRPEGAQTGKVSVAGLVEGRALKVLVELRADDYDLAINAHKLGIPVNCLGDLVKEGRQFTLLNPHRFALDQDDSSELPDQEP